MEEKLVYVEGPRGVAFVGALGHTITPGLPLSVYGRGTDSKHWIETSRAKSVDRLSDGVYTVETMSGSVYTVRRVR